MWCLLTDYLAKNATTRELFTHKQRLASTPATKPNSPVTYRDRRVANLDSIGIRTSNTPNMFAKRIKKGPIPSSFGDFTQRPKTMQSNLILDILEYNSMGSFRPLTQNSKYWGFSKSQRNFKTNDQPKTSLIININEEYAMKAEEDRLNRVAPIKEIFSCTMVSPSMKSFYNFNNLVALSNVNFSKGDSIMYPLKRIPEFTTVSRIRNLKG